MDKENVDKGKGKNIGEDLVSEIVLMSLFANRYCLAVCWWECRTFCVVTKTTATHSWSGRRPSILEDLGESRDGELPLDNNDLPLA